MGSTNGTFVNGEKITPLAAPRRRPHPGRHVDHQGRRGRRAYAASSREAEARRRLEAGASRQQTPGRPMSGVIEEIPLPDLLQLLSTSRKSGVLHRQQRRSVGKIYLRKGQIYFATINDDFARQPAEGDLPDADLDRRARSSSSRAARSR